MADYQQHLPELASQARIVAVSSDPLTDARKTQTDLGLGFAVGFGLDAQAVAHATGAFWDAEDEEPYVHATGFVIDAEGLVHTAIYSTGSGGRLTAAEALRFTRRS